MEQRPQYAASYASGSWVDLEEDRVLTCSRKAKKFFGWTRADQQVSMAYALGEYASFFTPNARNPYPPGRRHDEWDRGRRLHDGRRA